MAEKICPILKAGTLATTITTRGGGISVRGDTNFVADIRHEQASVFCMESQCAMWYNGGCDLKKHN